VDAAGFPTLMGARVRPLAHQISAALRVLSDRSQRYILADEVGLGKTIEAGLILQALWHHRPEMSVLVVTPGAMVGQWWRELYLRFGARVFSRVDAATPAADLDRQFMRPWVVVSLTALQGRTEIRERVASRRWEALVVDEAHHLHRSHPLYDFIHHLSERADIALVLSATPSQRQITGLAALLSLVAPDDYSADDVQELQGRIAARRETWRTIEEKSGLIEAAADEPNLTAEDVQDLVEGWGDALSTDPAVRRWLNEARALPPRKALRSLELALAYARERWRLDRRIIRTRRRTLQFLEEEYSQRQLEAELTYSASGGEASLASLLDSLPVQPTADGRALAQILVRVAATTPDQMRDFATRRLDALARGLGASNGEFAAAWESHGGPAEEAALLAEAPGRCPPLSFPDGREEDWLKRVLDFVSAWEEADGATPARHATAMGWLADRAAEDPTRRFLVFAQDVGTVTRFAKVLARDTDLEVRTFHHRMDEQSLDAAVEDFITGAARVLVSDDLGGEGRNLQIAWAVVHLDVPLSPGRLEQRIGRVDRLGRSADKPVRSVTVTGPLEAEQFLHQAHRDVFRVFHESIGGLEFVVPELVRQLREGMTGGAADPTAIIVRITAEVEAVRAEEDHAFQVGLDTSRAELRRARDIADTLAPDLDLKAAKSPLFWLQATGVEVDPDGPSRSRVALTAENLEVTSIPGVGRAFPAFQATWKRGEALAHERLQFLAPGHRLVDGAYQLLDSSQLGRAGLLGRNLGHAGRGRIFAVALFVTDLPDVGLNLPAGLVARARAEVGRDTDTIYMRHDPDARSWSELHETSDARLIRELDRQSFDPKGGDRDYSLDGRALLADLSIPGTLGDALEAPCARLLDQAEGVAEDAAERLNELWRAETAYFEALIQSGSDDEQQGAREELRVRRDLLARVRALRPRLDGLMVVYGT
jgi:superfamily II DNA or RNA helicase